MEFCQRTLQLSLFVRVAGAKVRLSVIPSKYFLTFFLKKSTFFGFLSFICNVEVENLGEMGNFLRKWDEGLCWFWGLREWG